MWIPRRSPCGERGLKLSARSEHLPRKQSLPVRGAWVEICIGYDCIAISPGRSPCGERGLKFVLRACFGKRQVAPRAGSVG